MEDPPIEPLERERVKTAFADDMKTLGKHLKKINADVEAVLSKKGNITQGEREGVRKDIALLIQNVESNIPFALSQFNEATDKITTAAKAEIDAFVTTAVTMLGFQRLDELRLALDSAKKLELPPELSA